MTKIEDHRSIPHKPLRSSNARYEKLLARYHVYKKRYPHRFPLLRQPPELAAVTRITRID